MLDLNMDIEVNVAKKEYKGTIRDIVKINEAILTKEFVEQPSLYAWFAALEVMASSEVENKKFELAVLRANLDNEKRTKLAVANMTLDKEGKVKEGKVTETMVESAILTDKKYSAINAELSELNRQYGLLKAIVRALEQRATMLVQLGSTMRQEMALSGFSMPVGKASN